jgi:phosphoglycerate dehydrogenase-like enzyme
MLLSKRFVATFGEQLNDIARRAGQTPAIVYLPDNARAPLSAADCSHIEISYLSRDLRHSPHYKSYGDALLAAGNFKWLHVASAGIDQHPWVPALIARGVKLTTSPGNNGEPVAQSAIGGLLMLARGFPHWQRAQRRHAWEPLRGDAAPADLRGQTILVVGVGPVGMPVARFCRALGMHVIGMRRTPKRAGDPLDEIYPASDFAAVLPRCQWLVLACPYTRETHHMLNAGTLAQLPRGAGLINVARGGLVDEPALLAALQNGQIGCAYLDVFETEPLAAESPLSDLPNVILTPHNATASDGNDRRSAEMFLANLERWTRGEPLRNELRVALPEFR